MCYNKSLKQLSLLDHADVGLHIHHVPIPPVVLEAQHQGVGLEAPQTCSLKGGRRIRIKIK